MMIIEKGVAFPAGHKTKKYKYPFSDMEVGDSFSVPLSDAKKRGQQQDSTLDAKAALFLFSLWATMPAAGALSN